MSELPAPNLLGGPKKFNSWRVEQLEAIDSISESPKRFIACCLPTGTGKSLAGVMASILQGKRAVILTSTKALQDQYLEDFHSIGMTDVRGMGNYECRPDILKHFRQGVGTKVDKAPCRSGYRCQYSQVSGCDYYDTVARGAIAPLVVTNYSFWLRQRLQMPALGNPDILILDEAHAAPDEVAESMRVRLYYKEISQHLNRPMPEVSEPFSSWEPWLDQAARDMAEISERAVKWLRSVDSWTSKDGEDVRKMRELSMRLTQASVANGDNWVVLPVLASRSKSARDKGVVTGVDIAPIWPRELAEPYLFRSINTVVLLSATMRPKTAELLGIPDEELDWREWDTGFPRERRPIVQIKTARMRYTMTEAEFRIWAERIRQIVTMRKEHKGIIHTVSYKRAKELMHLIGDEVRDEGIEVFMHDSASTARAIKAFKEHKGGAVLVSPVVSTGYDFPYEQCTYQVIGKVPWPDTRDPVTAARLKQDKTYGAYVALHEIVQATGRGMRAPDDFCETWIVDDFFPILANGKKTRHLLPAAFTRALVRRGFVGKMDSPWNGR